MYNLVFSYVASLLALSIIVVSYFVKKKIQYLLYQAIGIVALITSYFFIAKYFAMLSLIVALFRTITFGIFELKNKNASILYSYLFAFLTILSYVIVNIIILKIFNWLDLLHLIALCFYAFTFRIRNLTKMRQVILMPNVLEVLYNIILLAPIFTILSYTFELLSNIIAIIRFDIIKPKSNKTLQDN